MLKMQGLVQSIAFAIFFGMIPLTQFEMFDPSGTFSQSWSHLSERLSTLSLYIAMLLSEDGPLERDRTLCQVPLTLLIANFNSEAILIM